MGALNRRIEIAVRPIGEARDEARAVVEDDFHHFRVTLRAWDGRVREASSQALRRPTSLCTVAGERLSELIGLELNAAAAAVSEVVDARQQCTHQFDIAALAVAALAENRPHRVYEANVTDPEDECATAVLKGDGETVLAWTLRRARIVEPEPYAGRTVGSGFTAFARTLLLDEAEAALVLRRAVFVAGGRILLPVTGERRQPPTGGCWVFQPERANLFKSIPNSSFDFTEHADRLTRGDQTWLRFEADA